MPMPAAAVGFVSTAVALSIITALLQLHRRPSIPVIDLSTLAGPAADKAWRSAAANGVVLLRGHAIDTEAALDASRRFFELRDTVKHALNASRDRPGFVRGYIPLGGEAGVGNVLELKEGFSYGYEWPETEPPVDGLTGLNVWPHDEDMNGSDWRETMMALHGNCSALSQDTKPYPKADLSVRRFRLLPTPGVPKPVSNMTMRSLSAALGDATLPTVAGGESTSFMRMFHYLSSEQSADVAPHAPRIGSSPHTDWHVLTIVVQDETGGLQVLSRFGRWVNVPARRGEVVAFFGDYLALGSGGRVRSAIHRVLLPRRRGSHRDSFTFFAYPPFNATLPNAEASEGKSIPLRTAREEAAAGRYNTLSDGSAAERAQLARVPFGEVLLQKWRGVTSNRVENVGMENVGLGNVGMENAGVENGDMENGGVDVRAEALAGVENVGMATPHVEARAGAQADATTAMQAGLGERREDVAAEEPEASRGVEGASAEVGEYAEGMGQAAAEVTETMPKMKDEAEAAIGESMGSAKEATQGVEETVAEVGAEAEGTGKAGADAAAEGMETLPEITVEEEAAIVKSVGVAKDASAGESVQIRDATGSVATKTGTKAQDRMGRAGTGQAGVRDAVLGAKPEALGNAKNFVEAVQEVDEIGRSTAEAVVDEAHAGAAKLGGGSAAGRGTQDDLPGMDTLAMQAGAGETALCSERLVKWLGPFSPLRMMPVAAGAGGCAE